MFYDEGLGSPFTYESHPEHASFVDANEANCFPESKIKNVIVEMMVSLTKGALETDGLHAVQCCYMPIHMAFIEDYTAIDELTSVETQDVLEMLTESTDRQAHPLFNDIKLATKFGSSSTLPANQPGLTTTQLIEGVTFDHSLYYSALHYYTIAGKLKTVQSGMKWFTLTRNRPVKKIRFHITGDVKAMNPYTYFGIFFGVPPVGNRFQYHVAGDTTNISHVAVDTHVRYNEWNLGFDHEKV